MSPLFVQANTLPEGWSSLWGAQVVLGALRGERGGWKPLPASTLLAAQQNLFEKGGEGRGRLPRRNNKC